MSASEARLTSMAKPAIQYLLRRDDELSERVASRNTSPVLGYLATAGRALPVGDSFTALAGWETSETRWLNDVLRAGEPHTWARTRQGQWNHADARQDTSP